MGSDVRLASVLTAAALWGLLACGAGTSGPPDAVGGEADTSLEQDAEVLQSPDGCPPGPCEEGTRRCNGDEVVEKCVRGPDGCLRWEEAETCTDHTCVSFYQCQDGECVEAGPWPPPEDADGDGVCADVSCCDAPVPDCDDHDPSIHAGAPEVCDGRDNDCDGETDAVEGDPSNLPECLAFYADRDGDGHGDPNDAGCRCFEFGEYTAVVGDDCDDQDPAVPSEATGCVGGCPDGIPESPEACDDGNTTPFDGCDSCTGERNHVNPPDMPRSWDPAVAATGHGLVVAWAGPPPGQKRSQNIYARFVGLDLTLSGPAIPLHDESEAVRGSPALAARADGGFLAAWDAWGVDGDEFSVHARAFGPAGAPEGPEVTVNEHWQARQLAPALAVSGDRALVAWQSHDQDGDGYEVYARFLDVGATPVGPEFRVNGYTASDQFLPVVATVPGGAFAVAWVSRFQGPFETAVVLAAFDADHGVLIPEAVVSGEETGTEVALAASETLLAVAYVENRSSGSGGWRVHVVFLSLKGIGGRVETTVDPAPAPTDPLGTAAPALVPSGTGFLLAYLNGVERIPRYLRFDSAGTPVGGGDLHPQPVHSPDWFTIAGWPAATALPDGRVGVAYECSPLMAGHPQPQGLCLRLLPREDLDATPPGQ